MAQPRVILSKENTLNAADGEMPLFTAACSSDVENFQHLLETGHFDLNAVNHQGLTVIDVLLLSEKRDFIQKILPIIFKQKIQAEAQELKPQPVLKKEFPIRESIKEIDPEESEDEEELKPTESKASPTPANLCYHTVRWELHPAIIHLWMLPLQGMAHTFLMGGAFRDLFNRTIPADLDFVFFGKPALLIKFGNPDWKLFQCIYPTPHPLLQSKMPPFPVDISCLDPNEDSIHTLNQYALELDFTVNALFGYITAPGLPQNPNQVQLTLIDPTELGYEDLKGSKIRLINANPEKLNEAQNADFRFAKDPTLIFRLVRTACSLQVETKNIPIEYCDAARKYASSLWQDQHSAGKVKSEFAKCFLREKAQKYLTMMLEMEIFDKAFFPKEHKERNPLAKQNNYLPFLLNELEVINKQDFTYASPAIRLATLSQIYGLIISASYMNYLKSHPTRVQFQDILADFNILFKSKQLNKFIVEQTIENAVATLFPQPQGNGLSVAQLFTYVTAPQGRSLPMSHVAR